MNNIFLEGPIQTGKSTLIRKVLKDLFGPDFAVVAGFTSQRVLDESRKLCGFRLAGAEEPLEISRSCLDPAALKDIFKAFGPGGANVNMDVFESTGTDLLEEAVSRINKGSARVVLLDEIGGHEMACPNFSRSLFALINSDIPCIGVIKHRDSARRMDPSIVQLNEELRHQIQKGGRVLYFERQAVSTPSPSGEKEAETYNILSDFLMPFAQGSSL